MRLKSEDMTERELERACYVIARRMRTHRDAERLALEFGYADDPSDFDAKVHAYELDPWKLDPVEQGPQFFRAMYSAGTLGYFSDVVCLPCLRGLGSSLRLQAGATPEEVDIGCEHCGRKPE